MARPRKTVPTYRQHRSGRAVVSVYKSDGSRTEIVLPGEYGSDQSQHEYERLLAQLRANNGMMPGQEPTSDITIAEIVERFMREHVDQHFRRADGTPSGEVRRRCASDAAMMAPAIGGRQTSEQDG